MAPVFPVSLVLVILILAPGCWAGDCKGHRQVLRGPPGYVTDGPGNYSVNGNCEWLIKGMIINTAFIYITQYKCIYISQEYVNQKSIV